MDLSEHCFVLVLQICGHIMTQAFLHVEPSSSSIVTHFFPMIWLFQNLLLLSFVIVILMWRVYLFSQNFAPLAVIILKKIQCMILLHSNIFQVICIRAKEHVRGVERKTATDASVGSWPAATWLWPRILIEHRNFALCVDNRLQHTILHLPWLIVHVGHVTLRCQHYRSCAWLWQILVYMEILNVVYAL